MVFYFKILLDIEKLYFQHHPVFSVPWSFRNHSNMLIWYYQSYIYYRYIYYQCWKALCCL